MTHTSHDAAAALEDLRDAIRNVLSLEQSSTFSAAVLHDLTTRFDGDLADALARADKVMEALAEASELSDEEEEE